jgi:hypothetical protein
VSVKLIPEICNQYSLQQHLADSSRQVSHSLRETFTKMSPDFFFPFFSSFDETMTELESEAEGFKFHLNLGFLFCFVFVFWGVFSVCFVLFCFSPLMRQRLNYF